jgi:hypothetical protein
MPYLKFSTAKADYVLQLHRHDIGTQDRKKSLQQLEGVDAIVLETGQNSLHELLHTTHFDPQYDHAYQYALLNGVPLFGVDVPSSSFDFYRASNADAITIGLTVAFGYYFHGLKETEIPERSARKFAELTFFLQSPITAARDAITAEKVERYVVPRVKEITGKEHPKISLHYGTAHVGIHYDLESQLRRKITIWNLRNLNISHYGGYKLDDLNTVAEAHYNGHVWEVMSTKLTPPLFT